MAELRRQQILAERAAAMRAAPTRSEAALWEALRRRQLGVEVRRQVVLGQYVVDFLVPACRLVIEVDGRYHATRRAADARRERALRRLGYRVLRLDAELVVASLPVALQHVRDALSL
jgi:very-short-patch-repair endonuclease